MQHEGGDVEMTRKRMTLSNLIRNNKEELLRDREQLEKIEKRIDDKYLKRKKDAKAILRRA